MYLKSNEKGWLAAILWKTFSRNHLSSAVKQKHCRGVLSLRAADTAAAETFLCSSGIVTKS
jgi:hypothetical protein